MIPNGVSASGLAAPNDPSGFWEASIASSPEPIAVSICACVQSPGAATAGLAGSATASARALVQSTTRRVARRHEAFTENTGRSLPPGRRRGSSIAGPDGGNELRAPIATDPLPPCTARQLATRTDIFLTDFTALTATVRVAPTAHHGQEAT